MANRFIKDSPIESQLVSEGEEPDDFWAALGGKGSYDSTTDDKPIHDFQTARLFEWRKTKFEEIVQYEQSDLDDDDIIILGDYSSERQFLRKLCFVVFVNQMLSMCYSFGWELKSKTSIAKRRPKLSRSS